MQLRQNSSKRNLLFVPASYPNFRSTKLREKSNKVLNISLQNGRDLRKTFCSKQIFHLCQESTVNLEIEGRGMFKYARLRRFLNIYKKYTKNLKVRIAGEVFVDDKSIKRFLACFKQVYNLKYLDLEFSSFESAITNIGLKAILHQLRVYPNLKVFNILCNGAHNCLKDESMAQFSKIINRKRELTKLGLNLRGADNIITDQGMELFYKGLTLPICNLKSLRLDLKSFGINNNKLTDNGAYFLSLALAKLVALEVLFLDFSGGINCVGDDGLAKVAESLKALKNLRKFTLDCQMGFNEVSSRGARILSQCLNELNLLDTIYLNFSNYLTLHGGDNCIGDSGLNNIFSLIHNKPSLKEFVLRASRNNISDYGIRELAQNTSGSKCSYKLECDLSGNEKISKDSQTLFESTLMSLTSNCTIYV